MTSSKVTTKTESRNRLRAAIDSAVNSVETSKAVIQKSLILLLHHASEHGDWTEANTLAERLNLRGNTGLNNRAIVAWIQDHLGLAIDEEKHCFVRGDFNKAKAKALVKRACDKSDEYTLPQWSEYKPSKSGFKGIDADKAMMKFLKRVETAHTKLQQDDGAAEMVNLNVSAATMEQLQNMIEKGIITVQ